jgi:adenosylcobyric acid synthase
MTRRPLVILGTGSGVGKSTLVAGLCRVFARRGVRVAPFKAQNMALESVVTHDGGEIGRATALQAIAARAEPSIHMNPLLLKPKSDGESQLVVHGQPFRDVTAADYFAGDSLGDVKRRAIEASLAVLRTEYELIVAEGAGSCAEPNLRAVDVVNMEIAHALDADAFVVADIDKGGVFASLLGTLQVMDLVSPADRTRVQGFVLNKFRGARELLTPALAFVEAHGRVPVVGVLPWLPLSLEEEDRVVVRTTATPEIDVAVLYLPHVSNASDLDPLTHEPSVRVRWVRHPGELGAPDAIVLPGTKNTTWDLDLIRRIGLADAVLADRRAVILGICGGYQMLGHELRDPGRLESSLGTMRGLGLLDIDVDFRPGKVLKNGVWSLSPGSPFIAAGEVRGYEVHAGHVDRRGRPLFRAGDGGEEGAVSADGRVLGTLVHDALWNPAFARAFVNHLRTRKNLAPLDTPLVDLRAARERSLDALADVIERECPALVDR